MQKETETVLQPGELTTAVAVPAGPWTRRSTIVKVRDRESYEFALASAAVALDIGPVIDVFTYQNTGPIREVGFFQDDGPASTIFRPMSTPQIVHDGQIVELVVADTFEAARLPRDQPAHPRAAYSAREAASPKHRRT